MANVGDQVGASAKDAMGSVSSLLVNPVGGLSPAYNSLGPQRAMGAGLALCAAFAILVPLGVLIKGPELFGFIGLGMGFYDSSNFAMFLRTVVGMAIFAAAIVGVSFGARKVLSGQGPIGIDAFTAGAALTPLGIGMFVATLLGAGNAEIGMLLMLFGMTYLVLMLFAGLTRIGGLTEKAGAPAVPVIFVLSMWLCKVVVSAMSSGPSGL